MTQNQTTKAAQDVASDALPFGYVPIPKETLKKTSRSGEIRTSHEQNG